jgi:hypothetical protein
MISFWWYDKSISRFCIFRVLVLLLIHQRAFQDTDSKGYKGANASACVKIEHSLDRWKLCYINQEVEKV